MNLENLNDGSFWKRWNVRLFVVSVAGAVGILIPPPVGSILYFSSLVALVLLVLRGLQGHIRQAPLINSLKVLLSVVAVVVTILFYFVMVAFYFAFISLY